MKINGALIKHACHKQDTSKSELASAIGISRILLGRILSGSSRPSSQVIGQLASVLRLRDDDLFLPDTEGGAGDILRRMLKEEGLSQKDCARKAGLSYSFLNRIVNGRRKLSRSVASKIARALDIKITKLITSVNAMSPEIELAIKDIRSKIIGYFERHPEYLYDLSHREFEEFIDDLLADIGCNPKLMPQTKNGGRDVLAGILTSTGYILSIVDCKRFSDRLLDPNVLHRLLSTVVHKDRTSCKILATTSFSTVGSREIEKDYLWNIRLRDYKKFRKWIGGYGRWTSTGPSELWLSDYGHSE